MSKGLFLAAVVGGIALAGSAAGQDYGAALFGGTEIRGGVFAHSVDQGGPGTLFNLIDLRRIQDANVELLFAPPDADAWRFIGNPRPTLGATINFAGLESMAYAALTWRLPVFDTPVFVEGALGAAIHNGALTEPVAPPARVFGCSYGFYEAFSVGYQISANASIMATFQHTSHAGICGRNNQGITNLGVRLGWTF